MTGATYSPDSPGAGVFLPVYLSWGEQRHTFQAFIDSGAAGNCMDISVARRLQVPQIAVNPPFTISALDGRSLGKGRVTAATAPLRLLSDNHREEITLYLIDSPGFPVVLGFPWLNRHNPCIDWATGTVLEWGPTCQATCPLQSSAQPLVEPVDALELSQVPVEYLDLKVVFIKARASTMPPHRSYDCSIELLPGTSPSRGCVFSLPFFAPGCQGLLTLKTQLKAPLLALFVVVVLRDKLLLLALLHIQRSIRP